MQALEAAQPRAGGASSDYRAVVSGVPSAALDVPLQPLPGLRGVFLFGHPLVYDLSPDVDAMTLDYSEDSKAPPILAVNGEHDSFAPFMRQTFSRLPAPKAAAVLGDLNHYSIADRVWLSSPLLPDPVSTLSRSAQVDRVSEGAILWFDVLRAAKEGPQAGAGAAGQHMSAALQLLPSVQSSLVEWG